MAEQDLVVIDATGRPISATPGEVATISKLIKSVGQPTDAKVVNPDATSATKIGLLRGILQKVIDLIAAVSATTQRTPTLVRVTGSGTVAAGSRSLAIANVGDADGELFGGTVLKAGEVYSPSVHGNDTLGPVPYDATGTEFAIERTA